MDRRAVLCTLAGSFLAVPSSLAQAQPKAARIGFLYFGSRQSALDTGRYNEFVQGMRELGYVEGKNLVIEGRFADGSTERIPALAADLVRLKVDVIVATGTPVYRVLQHATTIPVVITVTFDPVGDGWAASMARPGGNMTGLALSAADLGPKLFELLRGALPRLARVAVLLQSGNPAHPQRVIRSCPSRKGRGADHTGGGRTVQEIEREFAMMPKERANAVIVLADGFFIQESHSIAMQALKHRLPSISQLRELTEAGGLMSYGPNSVGNFRRAATYVGAARVSGSRPATPSPSPGCADRLAASEETPTWTRPGCIKLRAPPPPTRRPCRTTDPQMERRTFIGMLAGGLLAAPLAAQAQPAGKVVTIGILAIDAWPPIDSFRQRLRELGYIEDQNVRFEYRYAEGRFQRFRELAEDLVALKVNVILTWGTEASLEARRATRTIPIVLGAMGDPVGQGIVSSLAHPGGNVTGLTSIAEELEGKRLELLKEIVPRLSRVAVLANPTNRYTQSALRHVRLAAETLKVSLKMLEVHDATTLDGALDSLTRERPQALLVFADIFFETQRRRIAQFALKAGLPSAYTYREHVEVGGLISYAPSYHDLFRRAATYVDKILKGAKPSDLPVEQPTKFELVINLKTAKALGLTIPPSLLARANEVIQ